MYNVWNQLRDSGKAGDCFLLSDPSKLKPYLFKPLSSLWFLDDEIEEDKACNICENQVPCSSTIGNKKWCKCGKC